MGVYKERLHCPTINILKLNEGGRMGKPILVQGVSWSCAVCSFNSEFGKLFQVNISRELTSRKRERNSGGIPSL